MKANHNHVIVKVDEDYDQVRGIYVGLTNNNKGYNAPRTGTVIAAPDEIVFRGKQIRAIRKHHEDVGETNIRLIQYYTKISNHYGTTAELKEGDKVWFPSSVMMNDLNDCGEYKSIPYHYIYCASREDEVVMCNGYLLVEPVIEQKNMFSIDGNDKVTEMWGVIKYLGSLNKGYIGYPDIEDVDELKAGMKIVFNKAFQTPLENDLHKRFDKNYFIMHRKDVLGYED